MAKQPKQQASKKTIGRPPRGAAGAKVSKYPHRISTFIESDVYHRLDLAAKLSPTHRSQREIIAAALACYLEHRVDRQTRASIESASDAAQRACPLCKNG
jgi:hypothetical protein